MVYNGDNIAALATPPGIGALAIIRISGHNLSKIFTKLTGVGTPIDRHALFTNILCLKSQKILDSGIVIYYISPRSFTGEDLIEINCHGGEYMPKAILNSLYDYGIRPANAGEFSYRAFMNGKVDLVQAESISELISSKTGVSANINLKNVDGYVSNFVNNLRDDLVGLLSQIEHELDFSEEEIEHTSLTDIGERLMGIGSRLRLLLDSSTFGRALHSGVRVVLFGPPNAGKSSLYNAILGFDRMIVSGTSGTTRDIVESWFDLGGYPVCLIDTAGYWDSHDELEVKGIARTRAAIKKADLILFIDEHDPVGVFKKLSLTIPEEKVLFIRSKQDRVNNNRCLSDNIINLSSRSRVGIDVLLSSISTYMSTEFSSDHINDPVIVSRRQRGLIKKAFIDIEKSIQLTKDGIEMDILSSSLYASVDHLEEVVGKIDNAEIVQNIFDRFCVGK